MSDIDLDELNEATPEWLEFERNRNEPKTPYAMTPTVSVKYNHAVIGAARVKVIPRLRANNVLRKEKHFDDFDKATDWMVSTAREMARDLREDFQESLDKAKADIRKMDGQVGDTDHINSTLFVHYADRPSANVDGTIVEGSLWTLSVKERDPYRVEVEIDDGQRELVPPANCDGWDDLDALLGAADEVLVTLLRDRADEYLSAADHLDD